MTGPEGSEKFQAASQNGLSFGSEGVLHPFGIVGLNLAAHYLGGGVILADNTLWDGKVVEDPLPTDAQTQEILRFNELVAADPRVECVIIPLRDGLSFIRKR